MTWLDDTGLIRERLLRCEAVSVLTDVHNLWVTKDYKKINVTLLFRDGAGNALDEITFSMDRTDLVLAEDTIIAMARAFDTGRKYRQEATSKEPYETTETLKETIAKQSEK